MTGDDDKSLGNKGAKHQPEDKHAGYEVDFAKNGRAGLGKIVTELPDLVIADLGMPAMARLELVAALRIKFFAADNSRYAMVSPFSRLRSGFRILTTGVSDEINKFRLAFPCILLHLCFFKRHVGER